MSRSYKYSPSSRGWRLFQAVKRRDEGVARRRGEFGRLGADTADVRTSPRLIGPAVRRHSGST